MICDVLIIKDGLPLLSKSFSNSSKVKSMFSELDNLIMISGFFSALNSFSDSFEDLGTISELKLSNNNLKLSFLKDSNISDLIFLATFDKDSDLKSVQRFLKQISALFLGTFNLNQIATWNGKLDNFKSFESIIEQQINEEEIKNQNHDDEKAFDWLTSFETDNRVKIRESTEENKPNPEYYNIIPSFVGSSSINAKNYLTGDTSIRIFENIDGKRTIDILTKKLNIEQRKVYNICKNLVKMGFISFN